MSFTFYLNRCDDPSVELEREIVSMAPGESIPFGLDIFLVRVFDDTGHSVGITLDNWYVT